MDLETALTVARARNQSVLTTIRRDGRPQLSNVLHQLEGDGVLRISTTTDRAKYKNLVREPWAALHVDGESFWSYVVIEGEVTLSEVARYPDDAAVEELVRYYRSVSGHEHPDWDDYRRAQVAEHRVVVRLTPTRAYGTVRTPAS
ncbi:MAG: PPOX class F420-dependent oxidoreductase [Marmoricola sp.]